MASAIEILNIIRNQFPQADPNHEDYDTGIDGCDAVDFIDEIMPLIIEVLDRPAPKVAVVLEGGLVQSIVSNRPGEVDATFMVVDYDTKHVDDDSDLFEVQQGDGTFAKAFARSEQVCQSGINLDSLLADLSNREG
ncbi:hypothetical protein [Geomonas subterranea]|uniref:hypothetical protein n=1 Tax=Geomonas subterranea TaxID=2847989 RepID=UPI001CD313E8|nr:hypothetical protein [Geomonas fuzhouensis]